MAKSAKISWITALIPIAAALLIWLGHVNPVWVILATILITLCSIWLSSYRSSK
jgi:chromate transport protein ChrA